MASEREAKRALEIHGDWLRAYGPRSIEVGIVGRGRRKTYGIVMRFERPFSGVPKTVDVTMSNKTVAVPVMTTSGREVPLSG